MTSRRSRTTSTIAALFTAVALGVPAAAQATTPAGVSTTIPASSSTAAATAAVPAVTPIPAPAASVVLPTGDRVTVGTGVNAPLTVDQTPGGSDAFATATVGGDRYVIPSEAAPYVGRALDLSLFDVTKLAAAPDPSAHIPVQLTFAAGVTPTAPAGVTFTAVSGQSATGYLTPDSGRAFAQALRDAIKADLAAGHQAGTAPVFGGLTSMAALGATTPVQPYYPLHILQLNTLDSTGAPSNALVILFNTDNFRTFNAAVFSRQGVIRVAVPAGNYSAMSLDFVVDPETKTTKFILVTQDGITVPATGDVPPATVDDRTATSQVTFTTQKPSTMAGGSFRIRRHDSNGVATGAGFIYLGGDPAGPPTTYVSPEAKPTTGTLDYDVNWIGAGPATASSPYRYNLGVIADHISANQAYAPADSSLATLRHSFDLDPAYGTNTPALDSTFLTPSGAQDMAPLPVPGDSLTEYVTGGLRWFSNMSLPAVAGQASAAPTILEDDPVLYNAGQTASRTWTHAPQAPSFGRHPAVTQNLYGCQACVGAGNMNVTLGMLGDSNKDTTGLDYGASGTAQLYWNGQLVSSDTDQLGYLLKNIAAGPATVRTVFDYDRSATGITQSTKIHTDVTIPYSGQDEPGMKLPSGTSCLPASTAGTPSAPCQILPALTLNYQLKALTNTNTSHSPTQNLVLHVGHLSYGGVGSQARIASAQVSVSFDNGATWQDVQTHGDNGTYAAHWANPAPGSPVQLKVTATDCLGGSITQTITNPYTVGVTS
ncbi:hypothetical protein [Catenulispora pinisilvae]|uniref:hypothetical protein n=1 Tax=Catenulispora pinisilvae TaxID=2705253 RepID=UPI001892496B|nr:hypothetical protein [Catenulispora pinisilvae]